MAMLLYAMGEKAEEIFTSFQLSVEDSKVYDTVLAKFESHFVIKKNVRFERYNFNKRVQEEGELAESFITALHTLAETCDYKTLKNDLIMDRIIVGIRDQSLSRQMMLNEKLTLEECIRMVRQQEEIKKQQEEMHGKTPPADVNDVSKPRHKSKALASRQQPTSRNLPRIHSSSDKCSYCGRDCHERKVCPARNSACKACGIVGHFAYVCRRKPRIAAVQERVRAPEYDQMQAYYSDEYDDDQEQDYEPGFVDSVDANDGSRPWLADVRINGSGILRMKVDSGADVCCISADDHRRLGMQRSVCTLQQPDRPLLGPDGRHLDVVGSFAATLRYKDRQFDTTVYVLHNVATPLLSRLASTQLGIVARLDAVSDAKQAIKQQYPRLFRGLGCMREPHRIQLKPDAQPYAVYTPRRIPIPLMQKVKGEIDRLLKLGVIEPVDVPTQWCAPIVVAPKGSGIRLCVDLSRLNDSVLRERHIMPSVDQVLAQLANARVFSKLDCYNAFLQCPLDIESRDLTTFITPFGRYRYQRVPYGISSAPEMYQKRMAELLQDIDGVVCLMDDILVIGRDQEEHDSRLHAVLRRLQDANVTLNDKMEISVSELKYVGHLVGIDGIKPDPEKVTAIMQMSAPTNVAEVRSFMGMINQLAKFSPKLAELSAPIRELLHRDKGWSWASPQQDAFSKLKKSICTAPTLALYDVSKPTLVCADASSFGLGGALLQKQVDDSWRPVTFVSRSMTQVEQRYAQIEKEALAVTWTCERLADYLVGLQFHVHTDHKPLIYLFAADKPLDAVPPRIQRFRLRMMRYSFSISYVPGATLCTADALSRLPLRDVDSTIPDIDAFVAAAVAAVPLHDALIDDIRTATAMDTVLQQVLHHCHAGWPDLTKLPPEVRQFAHSREHLTVCDGLLMYDARIVVPLALRDRMLRALHEAHQGIVKMRERARTAIWWPKMSDEIERVASSCTTCAHWRTPPAEPLLPSPLPDLPWQKVATDLFELDGKHYIIVMDYFSRYLELAELRSETADSVITALKSVFARHGIPVVVCSDNGPCYAAASFQQFAAAYGFKHITSSPRFAQANGEAERGVQIAKNLLRKATDPHLALLAYRVTPNHTGYSPAQLLMGRQLRSTLPLTQKALQPSTPSQQAVAERDAEAKQQQAAAHDKRHRARPLPSRKEGEQVWVPDIKSRATITQAHPHRSYTLRADSGHIIRRNARALRPTLPEKTRRPSNDTSPATCAPPPVRIRDAPPPLPARVLPPPPAAVQPTPPPAPHFITRTGRVVQAPRRLDL